MFFDSKKAMQLFKLRTALRGKIICNKCNEKPDRIEYAYNHRRNVLIVDVWCHGKFLKSELTAELAEKVTGVMKIVFPGDEPLLPEAPKQLEDIDAK